MLISSESQMYPAAVIFFFWAWDSFCVARRFWLPCYISKTWWNLAILCNFLSSSSFFNSKPILVSTVSNAVQSTADILLLGQAHCLCTTFPWSILPVVLDCLQPITSRIREKLASTPTPYGILRNMSQVTFERLVYFEYISSGWCQQLVISGNHDVYQISMRSEW
jgi:hypothetical protein